LEVNAASTGAALTFDDGPDPVWTPRILETLREADATATFFVIAALALRYPRLIEATLESGHGVEFHCYEHLRHTRTPREKIETDTREGLRALRTLGIGPRLWRPPWGKLAPWTREVAGGFGLELANWTADTHDWRGDAASEVLRSIEPRLGRGAIVLMHDGLGPGATRTGCKETVALVGPLVTRLRSLGCEPAPLSPSRKSTLA
jgi:peptidoglycan/xylan/chitin deacetylase (PgdA/CDA1 family)